MAFSAQIAVLACDGLAGERHTRVGIEVQAPRRAPPGELVRVDVHAFGDEAAARLAALLAPDAAAPAESDSSGGGLRCA